MPVAILHGVRAFLNIATNPFNVPTIKLIFSTSVVPLQSKLLQNNNEDSSKAGLIKKMIKQKCCASLTINFHSKIFHPILQFALMIIYSKIVISIKVNSKLMAFILKYSQGKRN